MNWKVLSSVGIMAVTISGVVAYDLVIKPNVLSTEVVVAKELIEPHTELNSSHLAIERRNKEELVKGYIKPEEMGELYGKDSNVLLLENQVLSKEFIDYENLTPDPTKNEAIRPLPSDWIFAVPGSLRRKDTITIYPVKDQDAVSSQTQSTQTVTSTDTMTEEEAEKVTPEEIASRFQPILKNVTVSYVKTSSNQEVTNEEGSKERLNASGTATDIEVNINEEQLKTLVSFIDAGYKLYISYR